jgi:D-beta-D-heptose 7-phosphate kinase/D-beta-D-heptose 1-phosphate adenosyltransferase
MTFDALAARAAILQRFPSLRVLVVGDLMLDKYLWGSVERVSPEAPVPVVHLQRESASLGGAANVASNFLHLGTQVEIGGLVGADVEGDELLQACQVVGIATYAVTKSEGFATISKTRVFASHQQMLRIDRENPPAEGSTMDLLPAVRQRLSEVKFDAVVLSDYAKGVCNPDFCRDLIGSCLEAGVPVYVDPKGTDYEKYRGATAVTPNKPEMKLIAQQHGWSVTDLAESATKLREHLGLQFVAVTLGADGILIADGGEVQVLPAQAREVYDVSGAGDTVIATLVAGLAGGLSLRDSVELSNVAAAIVVAQLGSTPVKRDDLLLAVQSHGHQGQRKLFSREDLPILLHAWRAEGGKVVLTNGCFDLLHAGHIQFLEEAAKFGDRLVVAINSDPSVSRIKGEGRPVMNEAQRISLLSALEAVDAIVVFEQDTPDEVIRSVRPDVLVKGSDHDPSSIAGADFVASYSGEVRSVPVFERLRTASFVAALEP